MKRLTLLSYTSLFFMGMAANLIGVIIIEVSTSFNKDESAIIFYYTLSSMVSTAAIMINGKFIKRINIKVESLISIFISIGGILLLSTAKSTEIYALGVTLQGIGVGLLVSISNHIIISLYKPIERAAKINMMNFFYCIGSIISPIGAGILLRKGFPWQINYISIIVLLLFIGILSMVTTFNFREENQNGNKPAQEEFIMEKNNQPCSMKEQMWNLRSIACGLSLICYVLSEIIMMQWIVTYLRKDLQMAVDMASYSISIFWISMAIGRFTARMALKRISASTFINLLSIISLISYGGVLFFKSVYILFTLIFMMGLGFSALYPTIFAYGTEQQKRTSPMLMTFLITCGAVGGMLASPIGSYIKSNFKLINTLYASYLFMFFVFIINRINMLKIMDKKIYFQNFTRRTCVKKQTC